MSSDKSQQLHTTGGGSSGYHTGGLTSSSAVSPGPGSGGHSKEKMELDAREKLKEELLRQYEALNPGVVAAHSSQSDRIVFAFRLCLSRRPQPLELGRLVTFYEQQLDHYRNHHSDADKLITAADLAPVSQIDRSEWAAWTILASLLLNLDETITRRPEES